MNDPAPATDGQAGASAPATGADDDPRPSLVALGDLVLDIVVAAPSAPDPGSDVPATIRFRLGGSAATTARVFAGLGGSARLVAAVGSDGWGRRLVAAVRASGVHPDVTRVPGKTARLIAFVAGDGERSFLTERAAADRLAPGHIRPAAFRHVDLLHVSAYTLLGEGRTFDAVARAVDLARRSGACVSVDLASSRPVREARLAVMRHLELLRPDIVIANEREAAALATDGPAPLLELAPLVVVKQGHAGVRVLWTGGGSTSASRATGGVPREISVAARPIAAHDTTGAGDAFAAGFLFAWARSGQRGTASAACEAGHARTLGARVRAAASAGNRAAAAYLTAPREEIA